MMKYKEVMTTLTGSVQRLTRIVPDEYVAKIIEDNKKHIKSLTESEDGTIHLKLKGGIFYDFTPVRCHH